MCRVHDVCFLLVVSSLFTVLVWFTDAMSSLDDVVVHIMHQHTRFSSRLSEDESCWLLVTLAKWFAAEGWCVIQTGYRHLWLWWAKRNQFVYWCIHAGLVFGSQRYTSMCTGEIVHFLFYSKTNDRYPFLSPKSYKLCMSFKNRTVFF